MQFYVRIHAKLDYLNKKEHKIKTHNPMLEQKYSKETKKYETIICLSSFFLFIGFWMPKFAFFDVKFGFYMKFPPSDRLQRGSKGVCRGSERATKITRKTVLNDIKDH